MEALQCGLTETHVVTVEALQQQWVQLEGGRETWLTHTHAHTESRELSIPVEAAPRGLVAAHTARCGTEPSDSAAPHLSQHTVQPPEMLTKVRYIMYVPGVELWNLLTSSGTTS